MRAVPSFELSLIWICEPLVRFLLAIAYLHFWFHHRRIWPALCSVFLVSQPSLEFPFPFHPTRLRSLGVRSSSGRVSHAQGHLPLAAGCFSLLFPLVAQHPALCSSRVAFESPAHTLFYSVKLPPGQVLVSIRLATADSQKDFLLALRSACVHSTILFGCFEFPT
jgi:hypothetical protein